ncbi:hypothetical protein KCP76_03325 [Salmonella enterica subsp. enterica serovar Weltevreden]|nr:hypothetical protein KCP76_03325 [Salmonella enterica subsp. enterica serovar Weltevreden]
MISGWQWRTEKYLRSKTTWLGCKVTSRHLTGLNIVGHSRNIWPHRRRDTMAATYYYGLQDK